MKPIQRILAALLFTALAACTAVPIGPLGPTATPSATFTPSASPTATPSPTVTPLPTPSPIVRIQSGEQALFYGDYEAARLEFETAYQDGDSAQVQAAALWGLARTEFADERYDFTVTVLQRLIDDFPDSAFQAYAHFLLGQTEYQLGHYQQSVQAFDVYLKLRPGLLDGYVNEQRGEAFSADRDFADALSAYEAALAAPQVGDTTNLQIKIADTRAKIGDYASAISIYDEIAANTSNDYLKAQMDYQAGLAYQSSNQNDKANEKFQHSVENYPLSNYAYLSLVGLVDANVPVNDLDRGLVDYFAEQYGAALVALERYMSDGLDADGTAAYYHALIKSRTDKDEEALKELTDFITKYPEHPRWADAWTEKANIYWLDLNDYPKAAQTYLDFVETVPTHPEAADALMSAARIYERNEDLKDAAKAWQRVADEYPDNDQVTQALFWAGIAYYRLENYDEALVIFQRDLILSATSEDQARAYLWVGKTQEKLGDQTAMQAAWQQAQGIDPTGYYSERARDLLIQRVPFEAPSVYNLDIDLAKEREDAAAWVRVQFGLPADTDLTNPGTIAQDLRFIRGTEFWELGLYDQARIEFESLREDVSDSPVDSFILANYMLDLGLYRSAIFAARQVLTLAGLDEHAASLSAPPYFNHIRYGLYYKDLIVSAADENNIHPLFLFSVVRQESLFEGFVRSTAGARGLMQIIPSTGASIVQELRWPRLYKPDDLYRPNVSLKLGAYYLASNHKFLDEDLYGALAAYNAGPGNARIWKNLAGDDPDLFLEIVRFQETRDYIRYIYEIYTIYRRLYSPVTE